MLADRRAKALVENFAGQWLYLRNLRIHAPDPIEFPDFDENLRLALEQEVTLFFDSQLREDHPIAGVAHGATTRSSTNAWRATTASRTSTAITSGAWS